MKTLGIDQYSKFLAYEGSTFSGYPIWPAPTLIAVSIVDESSNTLSPGKNQRDVLQMDYVFVDEGYDPTSRVRKGRLFMRYGDIQPHEWHVKPHPLDSTEQIKAANANGVIQKTLGTYSEFNLSSHLKQKRIDRPLFLLGNETEFTIWSLVDAEATVSGEPLVYLKARKIFGALPTLIIDAVTPEHFDRVKVKLDTLAEDLYRAGPESVIDRCREAATAALSAYLQQHGHTTPGNDLGKLAAAYDKAFPQNQVIAGQAQTIARLHSRGKNAEQEKRDVRPPTEADAELAVQAIGVILRDLGWAE
jgi:hypothetical protein